MEPEETWVKGDEGRDQQKSMIYNATGSTFRRTATFSRGTLPVVWILDVIPEDLQAPPGYWQPYDGHLKYIMVSHNVIQAQRQNFQIAGNNRFSLKHERLQLAYQLLTCTVMNTW